ncbi:MAG: hypothetical protein RL268_199 [Pseudomonadota bacterium]|jgi:nucleoside-triphosphatase THEP1
MPVFDCALGRELTPEEIAALPAETRPTIAVRKAALWEQVKANRDAMTDAPGAVTQTPLGSVQVDAKSKQNINGLVTMALIAKGAGAPFSEPFTLADNSVATLNADQMIGLGVAVGKYVAAVHEVARALRDAIEAAATHAALDAIDIGAGWP